MLHKMRCKDDYIQRIWRAGSNFSLFQDTINKFDRKVEKNYGNLEDSWCFAKIQTNYYPNASRKYTAELLAQWYV